MSTKEFPSKIIVRNDLTFLGDSYEVSKPELVVGAKVFVMDEDLHPIDLPPCVIAAPLLEYETDGNNQLLNQPRWVYIVQYSNGHTPNNRYKAEELLTEKDWREALQQAIDDDGVTLEQVAELHIKHGLKIHKEHIQAMWQDLDNQGVEYDACDIKDVCKNYLILIATKAPYKLEQCL